ncbi:MAG: hypothetical protein N5P05_004625 (plasmid) [Chroococcopsis gigantea SAG 12.99]|jgi:Ca2+-binding RTX toxin-like protein|nr:hypothetical protein [Chroococcopsis gigantea SAG 12.99]
MATFTGTNGNDNLPSAGANNSGNDIFIPGLGMDTVDGGDGDDLLIVDYSSNTYSGTPSAGAGISSSVSESSPGSFNGSFFAYKNSTGEYNQVYFSNIERFQITGTNFNDSIYTGWGNDSINGGGGNDTIDGRGGIDTIDGGAGTDTLTYLDGSDETANLTINNSGALITLSNGARVTGIEQFQNVDTGAGNDTITLTGTLNNQINAGAGNDTINPGLGYDGVDGNGGDDLLIVDYSSNSFAGITSSISPNSYGGWDGYFFANKDSNGNYDNISFSNIERFQVIGTAQADTFSRGERGFSIDGGNGVDTIATMNLDGETANLVINNSGAAITLSDGSVIKNVEQFQNLTTGSGNDTITFTGTFNNQINAGAGNDTINAGLGNDNVDGNGGDDLFIIDYSSNSFAGNTSYGAGIASSISSNGYGGWNGGFFAYKDSNGNYDQINFYNIERFQVIGTAQADTFDRGERGFTIDGGNGIDTITTMNLDGETANLVINNSGAAITLSDGSVIKNVEQFQNLTTGSGNDTITFTDTLNHSINTSTINQGAGNDAITTGSGNDNINGGIGNDTINPGLGSNSVDGGKGNDLLILNYSSNTYAGNTSYGAGITSSISPNGYGGWNGSFFAYKDSNGNYDQINFYNIERFQVIGTAQADTFDRVERGFSIDGGNGVDTITTMNLDNETANLVINNSGAAITLSDGSVIKKVEQFQNLTTGSGNDTITFTDTLNHYINTSTSNQGAGNDAITTGSGNDNINGGIGNDTINPGLGQNSVDGGKGNDLLILNYSSNTYAGNTTYKAGVQIGNFYYAGTGGWSGSFSAYKDSNGNYDYVYFYNIERFDLTGTNYGDSISGGSNNDTIRGGAGADSLNGGSGVDTLSYAGSNAGVNVNLATNTATGGHATGDVISNFESLIGSSFNDTLTGGNGNNTINGGAGADSLNGGTGIDTLSYETSTVAVNVNLATNTATGGDGTGDVISNFENLTGSGFNDTLTGNSGANAINGGAGNDLIVGGAGADSLDGGTGVDTLAYDTSTVAVNVNLDTNTATGGDAAGDVISNIENLTGSGFNDTLTGNSGANAINGGAGNDLIVGGAGADSLDGGTGVDTLAYDTSTVAVNVNLTTNTATGGDATGDVISNFENLTGSGFNDTLTGNAGNNVLLGGLGNDSLTGAAGADTLTGGAGSDRFAYATLTDSLLTGFDAITDFNATAGNDLFRVTTARSAFTNAGAVVSLSATDITAKLTTLGANAAAQFNFGTRIFVAINDATAGFSSSTDAIVEVTGLTGTLALANFVTT